MFSTKQQILNNFFSIDPSSVSGTPITLAETKAYLTVTFDDDDTFITSLIAQCIDSVEQYAAVSILNKTITLSGDIVSEFELPYGPVTNFTSASLRNNGAYAATTSFTIDNDTQFARYVPGTTGRLKLIYTVGYGATLPPSLKLAVLNEVAFRYENRGDSVNRYAAQNVGISEGAQALAAPYRRLLWL